MGSRNKYEYDPDLAGIRLDRFVSASVVYPTDYGYVVGTLAPDGDPLDALICVSEPTFPGCIVFARPVALLKFEDEKGPDDHVLCVPCDDPGWNAIEDLDQVPDHLLAEIGHFFSLYKDLDAGRASEVRGWGDRAHATATLDAARRRFTEAR